MHITVFITDTVLKLVNLKVPKHRNLALFFMFLSMMQKFLGLVSYPHAPACSLGCKFPSPPPHPSLPPTRVVKITPSITCWDVEVGTRIHTTLGGRKKTSRLPFLLSSVYILYPLTERSKVSRREGRKLRSSHISSSRKTKAQFTLGWVL